MSAAVEWEREARTASKMADVDRGERPPTTTRNAWGLTSPRQNEDLVPTRAAGGPWTTQWPLAPPMPELVIATR
jgi:hypothetical protein